MPWSKDDGGGGGSQGPWGQGPWGQGPRKPQGQGPGGKGPVPPDLDEAIRRGRDWLNNLLPGGFGLAPIVLLLAAGFWLFQSVYTVQPNEQGVVLQFGKYNRTTDPGLHMIMWPVEEVYTAKTLTEQISTFGVSGDTSDPNAEGLMLAGDQNIVDIEFTVLWRISDARAYLFNVENPEELLRFVSESAMREYVGRSKADDVRTQGRLAATQAVQKLIQDTLNSYNAGITINGLQLNKADPPQPVLDAFAEVTRAQQDRESAVNDANKYAFDLDGKAKGQAAKTLADAEAYKGKVVAEAQGEAQRFTSVYDQYKNAKDVTRRRLYIETMEQLLAGSKKVIIEQGANGSGVVPYLPLPEIKPAAPSAATGQ